MPSRLSHTINKFSYKTLALVVVFLLIPIVLLIRINQKGTKVEAAWWNETWTYRKLINITNSSGSQLTNQRIKFQIDTQALITAGKMKNNCDDVRITDINGKLLDHWDTQCNSVNTTIFVKTETLPSSGASIYFYYGNPSASSVEKILGTSTNPGTSCQMMKDQGSVTSNGTYYIVPQGIEANKMQVYCDQTNDSGGWNLIVNQNTTTGGYFTAGEAPNHNENNPTAAKYSILNRLSRFKQNGSYTFKLNWPGYSPKNIWSQTSNPTSETIAGYTPIGIGASNNAWGGIYLSEDSGATYLDGSPNSGTSSWWYAIASYTAWSGGLPSDITVSGTGVPQVQLWIRGGDDMLNTSAVPTGSEEISQGPVVSLKFDEGIGTTAFDSSSNRLNSQLTGTSLPTWIQEDKCITGKCLSFDGIDNAVNLPYSSKWKSDNFTISFWLKQLSMYDTNQTGNAAHWVFSPDGFGMAAGSDVWINDSVGRQYFSGCNYNNLNKWQFVTLTYNKTTGNGKFYVNGNLNCSRNLGAGTSVPWNGTSGLLIGSGAPDWSARAFIDEFKIYPYDRSDAQIKSDYISGSSGQTSSKGSAVILGSSTQNGKSLSDGLVAYWKMNETSINGTPNEVVDSSGLNHHGTAIGATKPTTTGGKYGNAISYNGVTDYSAIEIPTSTNLAIPGDVSVSAWVKPSSSYTDQDQYVLREGIYADQLYSITFNAVNRTVGFAWYDGSWKEVKTTDTIPFNTWSHLTVVRSGTNIKIFINGKQSLSSNAGTTPIGSNQVTRIGGSGSNVQDYSGLIDEVRIYNRAISADDVINLFEYTSGPIAYWKFDEGIGTSALDSSGNNLGVGFTHTPALWSQGKFGKGISFSENNDALNINDNNLLDLSYSGTIGLWAKSNRQYPSNDGSDNYRNFVNKSYSGGTAGIVYTFHWFGTNASSNLRLCLGDGSSANCQHFNIGPLTLNEWNYFTATWDPTSIKIYKNGQLVGNAANSTAVQNVTHPVQIGGCAFGSCGGAMDWNGTLDDIKIYSYARSQREIVEDMNAGHPIGGSPIASQLAYWKFDEGYGSTSPNYGYGGSSLNTSLSNTSWSNDGKFGKALSFNGSSSNLSISGLSQLNNSSYTITGWMNLRSQPGYYSSMLMSSTGGLVIYFDQTSRRPWTQINNGSTWIGGGCTSQAINLNEWGYLALVYDESTKIANVYFNGKKCSSDINVTGGMNDAYSTSFNIGAYAGSYHDGLIDEVKIYNTALSDEDIRLDYNQGKSMQLGSLSSGTGNTAPPTAGSQQYCVPGDTSPCSPPVAEWKFDEGIGTTAFDTSGNNNQCIFGAGTSAPNWINTGKIGKALGFNNTNYCSLNLNPGYTTSTTISFWYKPQGNGYMLDRNWGWLDFYQSGTTLNFRVNPYPNLTANSSLNTWHFATGIVDNASQTFSLYLDGKYIATSGAGSTMSGAGTLTIGSVYMGQGGNFFNGQLDQVRIYNYARTPAQIAWDYNRGSPIAHWKIDDCQGSQLTDWSGNGYHINLNIGASGSQTSVGTCQTPGTAWGNGATGKFNSGINLDGNDDKGSGPSGAYNNLGYSDFTISSWLKTSSPGGQSSIISIAGGPRGFRFGFSGGYPYALFGDGTNYNEGSIGNVRVDDNNWHLITLRYLHHNRVEAYVDGKYTGFLNTATVTGSTSNGSSIFFGTLNGTNGAVNGIVDDIRVYGYLLTPEQIKTIYNNGSVNFSSQ